MTNPAAPPGRGERWVIGQVILLGLIALAPILSHEVPGGDSLFRLAGILSGLAGLTVGGLSLLHLGGNLTIFPRPIENGVLTQRGVYGLVRHPMYLGVCLMALGWSLFLTSPLAAALTVALGFFFDRKASREEIWLQEKYADYPIYRKRVRKLIPWIY
jgi:protein-S-isoprenylcysteine O-methyltransferase Ste14